jgi:methane/ammonia monooxygenase subunit C
MSMTTESRRIEEAKLTGLSFYLKAWPNYAAGVAIVFVIAFAYNYYELIHGHTHGLDFHTEEFQLYWMRLLYAQWAVEPIVATLLWGWLWMSRDKDIANCTPREELRRYFGLWMFLGVYAVAVYWGGSYFTEQDGAWHNVVIRDTSFTPSHITEFYMAYPMYIICGVGSLIYAYTRLPIYQSQGLSVPHVIAVVGPFMILPNVGLNEWGHAFWFMEELFVAPLHWGFVVLGWFAMGWIGIVVQTAQRVNVLIPQITD